MTVFWIVVLAVIGVLVYVGCRQMDLYNDEPVSGRYIIVNRMTGHAAFNGRQFKSQKAVGQALHRLTASDPIWADTFEVRQIN